MNPKLNSWQIENFWARVDKSAGPEACWPWIGGIQKHESTYRGGVSFFNVAYEAHRIAYMLTYPEEELTSDDYICHTCDNGICCNPKHTYKGDAQSNATDREHRHRQVHPAGSALGQSKLTEEDVREIRKNYTPRRSHELAQRFGTNCNNIREIAKGRAWKHVKEEPCV